MGRLADNIRLAVREERYIFGAHADQRLRERQIAGWQVVDGLDAAQLIVQRPKDLPNPTVEFEQILADGTPVKAAWAWLSADRIAKLVTVHFFDM